MINIILETPASFFIELYVQALYTPGHRDRSLDLILRYLSR